MSYLDTGKSRDSCVEVITGIRMSLLQLCQLTLLSHYLYFGDSSYSDLTFS